jgi:hypothetical protein
MYACNLEEEMMCCSKPAVRALSALLLAALGSAAGLSYQVWQPSTPADVFFTDGNATCNVYLTSNSGSHAVAMQEYYSAGDECYRTWVTVVGRRMGVRNGNCIAAAEYTGLRELADTVAVNGDADMFSRAPCIAMNPVRKHVAWGRYNALDQYKDQIREARQALTNKVSGWPWTDLMEDGHAGWRDHVTVEAQRANNIDYVYVAYVDSFVEDETPRLRLACARSLDNGGKWDDPVPVEVWSYYQDCGNPSIAVEQGGTDVYLVCEYADYVYFYKSTDNGQTWGSAVDVTSGEGGERPCVAAIGDTVFVVWEYAYRWSVDGGSTWLPEEEPEFLLEDVPWRASRPNLSMVRVNQQGNARANLVLVCAAEMPPRPGYTDGAALAWASYYSNEWHWSTPTWLAWSWDRPYPDTLFCPSVASTASARTSGGPDYDTAVFVVWDQKGPDTYQHVYRKVALWRYYNPFVAVQGEAVCGVGRHLWGGPSGELFHAGTVRGQIVAGPVLENYCLPVLVDAGWMEALALDSVGSQWLAYLRDDTLWCRLGDGSYKAVFAGSSSAVPGQPSIVCYPTQGGGGSAANIVFAVYDTAGGASRIMYARVDTSAVVLDTIESVNTLRDSLPCINVYKSDTLLVTWQHGDSTLSSLLSNYGPLTQGQPGAWSSPNLVTASGYHPMSAMENGSVLNCVWTQKSGSNYSIQRATCDLASTMFGSWTAMATPAGSGAAEKGNPVYAGVGASVWQQKDANGKWVIRGMVRGDTMTFVANDTDAYHPHAVAESSAVSPSIDQVRVHLLYTAGVAFEVDSGVYDTGETRYKCESLNVSHAGSDATKYNNGAKLIRKNGSDSLFAVYSDADGAIAYAWSAAGDSWRREIMTTGRDYPAIAGDSSGKRWVVMRKPGVGMLAPTQEAYYRNGSSWTGPQTLYSVSNTTLGPASLSGSSYVQSGIAYAAFISTAYGGTKSLILAKFNGTNVSTYTVATGSSLGDPSVTIEPYKADSDRVHVAWVDNGTLKYRMDTDGRSTSIASNWTSVYSLTGQGIVASHPYINSDHDQIVAAWAQGTPADVYSSKRATSSAYNVWDTPVDLSNTAQDGSDYPTVAMGDTVVVVWQELRCGGSDFDIMACIDFGDTLNIADNATFSTYPHVLFQNKASGDTAIPYIHTIWSETPLASYYEVGYNKLNLKQSSGEGQQSASSTPIPTKPVLASCRPNPFRDRTQISYALPTAGNVSLRVYDATGRTVRTLASGHQRAGSYSVTWDSRDNRGRQVPRGVYFYRLDTPGFRSVKKAVVTR